MTIDDKNYIRLLKEKNEEAMEYVIRTYGGIMKTVITRILHSYPQDAEECLSDSFIKIWKHIDSFDSKKSSFVNWVCGIARYTALNKLKAIKRLTPTESIDELLLADKTSITDDSEFNAFFTELISCLNDEDKELFIEIFWQGYSVEETANATGKSKEIIYNHISRGKKKIIKFNSGYFGKGTI